MFAKHNLSQLDMIALSRAHTVGFSHCQELTPSIAINMDHVTPQTFDNTYFQNLVGGKGLFTSDRVLLIDPASQPTVNDLATGVGAEDGREDSIAWNRSRKFNCGGAASGVGIGKWIGTAVGGKTACWRDEEKSAPEVELE
ncbi:Peroxidase 35 [Forsythia ovata]|uniref:peroxidase n=1 Tax=Forsythia ovata TaxID=205694 RepID=A0ABD1X1R7_9LAMI